ncbi:MAG: molybdenum cofactor guanylyltransferase [Richelia sp. RM2_1_2]|nr:molybdenum cofactor guanylyltransferase [Richelia sp. SM2_1_7]NJM18472.1 molybdenum cofactor guanylyltransferase [Richelia sp. SM1_7_0]NJN07031.1 molybdenum cofactor guanylyltransferase [Richelia sp. RM1_1_1]NJO27704.1 molybdenum cofactor guanylyltransferase [Richelia sp. SL_2_1]NJO60483.1 molybdenum cofactor guanylyltransferase [Richelia sp. RM2_1_2]
MTTLILAGGKSSRMGTDKALVIYQGKPILQRVYQVAAVCTEQVYVLTPWAERYQNILPSNCQYLIETQPGRGPMNGLCEGLAQITADWILLLACDLPLLNIEILQSWINKLPQIPTSTLALVPQRSQFWEPMCGFYRKEVKAELDTFLKAGKASFQELLSNIEVEALNIDEKTALMLFNCNYPGDLENKNINPQRNH